MNEADFRAVLAVPGDELTETLLRWHDVDIVNLTQWLAKQPIQILADATPLMFACLAQIAARALVE